VNLTRRLAINQLKQNRKRSLWTLFGIVLSTAMITAVYGFSASGINAMLELVYGWHIRRAYYITFYGIGAVLSIVIAVASIIVVSNAFRVSAGKRLVQFGILKSVGATKKQIAQIILYEGIYIALIGIPIGLAVGLLVQFIGITIVNNILYGLFARTAGGGSVFAFTLALPAMAVSIVIAIATVLISAWLPARKAAKIPAIDAIRGVGEVKLKRKHVRTSKLIKLLFGFEGMLAVKSLRRNKRNLRATVVSITISIVMFIAVSSFVTQLNRMASVVFFITDADIVGSLNSTWSSVDISDGERYYNFTPLDLATVEEITTRLQKFPGAEITTVGRDRNSAWGRSIPIPRQMMTSTTEYITREWEQHDPDVIRMPIDLITLDAETYAMLCRLAGVPLGSNILVNHARDRINDNWAEFTPFVFDYQILQMPCFVSGEIVDFPLHGYVNNAAAVSNILHTSAARLVIVVPPQDVGRQYWFVNVDDTRGFANHMHDVFQEFIDAGIGFPTQQWQGDPFANVPPITAHVLNVAANQEQDRNIIRVVMIFTYGFVAMLTLVGLTNVISTLSTSVHARAREIAVLRSVGMTQKGLNRMLNLESILCSAKSIIYGVPLGVIVSLLLHQAILQSVYFAFPVPWLAIVQSIAAVFIITWVTMRTAAAQLKGRNIVEDVRQQ